MLDAETGLQPNANTKKIIYESFKEDDKIMDKLEKLSNKDKLGYYDSNNPSPILRFY